LGKRAAFALVVTAAAKAELGALRMFERRRVADAIDANLLYDPLAGSRARKPLGTVPAGFVYRPPLWELKVGDVRVFYDVDEQTREVVIRAVRTKPPGKTTQEVVQ
jgi:mRNA-degrading endonuclease RelE of RelBE toxin-antitoxin system